MQAMLMTENDDVRDNSDRSYEEILARCTSMLETMMNMLLGFEPLMPVEARTMTRMPGAGSDKVIGWLADECNAAQFEWADRETTVSGMVESLERARLLRDVIVRCRDVIERLDGERRRNEAASWRAALLFYAVLKRVEKVAPEPRETDGWWQVKAFFERRRGARKG